MPSLQASDFIYDLVEIHGMQARVYRKPEPGKAKADWPVVDIQLPLTNKQYGTLITKFADTQRRWQTSCYTKIFQDELAAFEGACVRQPDQGAHYKADGIGKLVTKLRTWSQAYVDLEALVNNPPQDRDALKKLIDALDKLYLYMVNQQMPAELLAQLVTFRHQANGLRDKFATKAEIRQFFSIQKEKRDAPCLGKFLADQMSGLARYGSDEVYRIQSPNEKAKFGNRFGQAFAMHPLLKYLSDAQANIEVKSDSIYGTELNSSFAKVPKDMLDSMRGTIYTSNDPATTQWTSIAEHVNHLDNMGEIDTVVKTLKAKTDTPPAKSSIPVIAGVFGANVLELIVMAFPRFGGSLVLGLVHVGLKTTVNTLGQLVGAFGYGVGLLTGSVTRARTFRAAVLGVSDAADEGLANGFKAVDKQITRGYQFLSPVARAKKWRNNKLAVDNNLLKQLNQPVSVYDQLLGIFGSADYGKFAGKAADSGIETLAGASYSVRALATTVSPNDVAREVQEATRTAWAEKVAQMESGALPDQAVVVMAAADGSGVPAAKEYGQGFKVRGRIARMQENKISSFMTPLMEIGIGLSDEIIGPMFRKSPGLATICFLAANATFGALTAPGAASALLGSDVAKGMSLLGHKVGGWTMGKATGQHLMANNLFAAFLQWKLTFFPLELVGEVAHGDMQFLEKLLHNPEKLTLGMTVMVGMGWAMQFLPAVPNIRALGPLNLYGDIANIFGHEAHEVSHGGELVGPDGKPIIGPDGEPLHHNPAKWPLNSLEYAFLSLKSIFILQTMAEGSHGPMSEPVRKLFSPVTVPGKAKPDFKDKYPVLFDIIDQMRVNATELAKRHGLPVVRDKQGNEKFMGSFKDLIAIADIGDHGFQTMVIQHAIETACEKHKIVLSDEDLKIASGYMLTNAQQSIKENEENNKNAELLHKYTMNPDHIAGKRKKLLDAIQTVIQMEQMGTTFETLDPLTGLKVKDTAKANAYYDYLYQSFKAYNAEQRRLGHPENEVDKDTFLQAFYNKHCYTGSNNLIRMFSIVPGYPITIAWRYTQSFINNTVRPFFGLRVSAALNEKLDKSWAKDKVIGYQWLAIGGRVGHEFVRAYTYTARAAYIVGGVAVTAALWVFPVGPAVYAYRVLTQGFAEATYPSAWKGFNNRVDEAIQNFALHENQGRYLSSAVKWIGKTGRGFITGIASAILPEKTANNIQAWADSKDIAGEQSRAARKAGIGSEHLMEAATSIQSQLAAEGAKDIKALGDKKAADSASAASSSSASSESSSEPEFNLPSANTTMLFDFDRQKKGMFNFKAARKEEKNVLERYARGVALVKDRTENLMGRSKEGQTRETLRATDLAIRNLDTKLPTENVTEELKRRSQEMKTHLHTLDKLEQEIIQQEKHGKKGPGVV